MSGVAIASTGPNGGSGASADPAEAMPLHDRLSTLVALLDLHADLWRPSPFRDSGPAWTLAHPALASALRSLDDAEVRALTGDPALARRWLARWLPGLAGIDPLVALPQVRAAADAAGRERAEPVANVDSASPTTPPPSAADGTPRFAVLRDVPGRKAEQIEAFARAVGAPVAPVFEACAGKGHLGRCLLATHGGSAQSMELDHRLCGEGERLARRLGIDQRFIAGDIHDEANAALFFGRHVVALHACGDLHRRVIESAANARAPAIDIAPCCYQKSIADPYRAETSELSALALDRNALQLAVTETVTASPREAAIAARQQAWKLAFVAWRERFDAGYRPFMPVPAGWWREGFSGVFRRLAERDGQVLPADADFSLLEAEGWRRWRLVERLQLVRFAFRRAIEVALLCDLALGLERRGYAVRLGEFCSRRLTPRNVLVSARLL